jgi:hypothetical protein
MRTGKRTGPAAALVTAGLAAGIVGLGVLSAGAGDLGAGSFETAPALSCPDAQRVVLPHGVGDALLGSDLTPTQVVNSYVARTAGWTNLHALPATMERPVAGSSPQAVEVDVLDKALNRIGVFVVTKSGSGWVLTRSFECGNPQISRTTVPDRVGP